MSDGVFVLGVVAAFAGFVAAMVTSNRSGRMGAAETAVFAGTALVVFAAGYLLIIRGA